LGKNEDGWIVATCPSLPGFISQDKTKKQALDNVNEAIELHIKALTEDRIATKSFTSFK
jgi:predicted RNase H-like HicB family nuclease